MWSPPNCSSSSWVGKDDSKLKWIAHERIEKFVDEGLWQSINLNRSRLYSHREKAKLKTWTATVGERPTFANATASAIAAPLKPAEVGHSFGPSWSTHWVRLEWHRPDDWKDKLSQVSSENHELHLLWNSNCEAMIWSDDGRILQGLTGGSSNNSDTRTEFILPFDCEKLQVWIEVACNGLFGVGEGFIGPPDPNRTFSLDQAEVAVFDREYYDLYFDFMIIKDLSKCLSGVNNDSKSPTTTRGLQAMRVAHEVMNVLDFSDRSTFRRASTIMKSFLAETNGSGAPIIHAVGHCHIDTAWLWPYAETRRKVARSWSSQLELMKRYPAYKFAASQAVQYDWLKQDYPELFERVKSAVQDGRFLPQGGSYVEPDCNIPCGESLVRQVLYGQRFFQKELGRKNTCEVFWLPDTFGYSSQIPQILSKAGFKYFLTQKLSWSLMTVFPHHSFNWQGLDGTRILTHFPPADDYNSKADVPALLKNTQNNKDRAIANDSLMLFGHGDGGGGPDRAMLERIHRLGNVDGCGSRIQHGTPEGFFDKLHHKHSLLPVWDGELYLELHRGTYTTGGAIKKANRMCENLLKELEIWCSFIHIYSPPSSSSSSSSSSTSQFTYPAADIERLWKLVLTNQFHDVLPATCIHEAMLDALKTYHQVWKETKQLILKAMQRLIEIVAVQPTSQLHIDNFPAFPLIPDVPELAHAPAVEPVPTTSNHATFFNATCVARICEIVRLPENAQVPSSSYVQQVGEAHKLVAVDTPAFAIGSAANSIRSLVVNQAHASIEAHGIQLSNGLVRVVFNSAGRIQSLYDIADERELIKSSPESHPYGGNHFVLFQDNPFFWDAWDVEVHHLMKSRPVPKAAHVKIIEAGPLRASVEITFQLTTKSSLVQTASLSADNKRIDFHCRVEWHESHEFLKVEFPLNLHSSKATYEIQYGHLERATHCNTPADLAKFEVAGQRWMDLSESGYGVALLTDCKYGFACHEGLMRLSLLRSPKKPDDVIDMGTHEFRFALLPHIGRFESSHVIAQATAFNQPLSTVLSPRIELAATYSASPSLLSFESKINESVVIDAIKKAEDSSQIIVRMYESFGGRSTTKLRFNQKQLTWTPVDLLERNLEEHPHSHHHHHAGSSRTPTSSHSTPSSEVKLAFKPFEIISAAVSFQ